MTMWNVVRPFTRGANIQGIILLPSAGQSVTTVYPLLEKSESPDSYIDKGRKKLFSVKGLGEETADSIPLYACNKPVFVPFNLRSSRNPVLVPPLFIPFFPVNIEVLSKCSRVMGLKKDSLCHNPYLHM